MPSGVLFSILKKIIIPLESFGFQITVAVTDNNSINKKCMSKGSILVHEFVCADEVNEIAILNELFLPLFITR